MTFEEARQYAKQAVMADRELDYKNAIQNYLKTADILLVLRKKEPNPRVRTIYYEKIKKYLLRVIRLNEIIRERRTHDDDIKDEDEEEKDSQWIFMEKPNVKWSDVANLENAKQALTEAAILPLARPDLFHDARKSWKGILLFGPPGCGKTYIAKAVASSVSATFFSVSAANLISKWLGESEQNIQKLYRLARKKAPSIIFFDEVDALAGQRDSGGHEAMMRVKNQLLQAIDGMDSRQDEIVLTLGATNIPWTIDPAMRRRFQKRIYIGLPEIEARTVIFKIHTRGIKLDSINYNELGERTAGYTGADIALICQDALLAPLREHSVKELVKNKDLFPRRANMDDFIAGLVHIKPSVSPMELARFLRWARKFASVPE